MEVSYPTFGDWRAQSRKFEDLAPYGSVDWSWELKRPLPRESVSAASTASTRGFWYRVAVLDALLSIEATASLRERLTDHIFMRDEELGRHLVSRVPSRPPRKRTNGGTIHEHWTDDPS